MLSVAPNDAKKNNFIKSLENSAVSFSIAPFSHFRFCEVILRFSDFLLNKFTWRWQSELLVMSRDIDTRSTLSPMHLFQYYATIKLYYY